MTAVNTVVATQQCLC